MRYIGLSLILVVQFTMAIAHACSDGSMPARSQHCSESALPQIVCLKKGYQPSACTGLDEDCNGAQATCLNKGYQPSSCQTLPKSSGSCGESKNPTTLCLEKGYQPSACVSLDNGCNRVQVACLEQGYSPSSCQ